MPSERNRLASGCRGTTCRAPTRAILISLILGCTLFLAAPVLAAHGAAYAWTDADLALLYPEGWQEPVASADPLSLTLGSADRTIVLTVLPAGTDSGALRAASETQLAALNLLPLRYAVDAIYGRGGLRIDAVSASRQQVGIARSGWLPDGRGLVVAARAPAADQAALEAVLSMVLNSIVFSAQLPPVKPGYYPLWSAAPADQTIAGLAASAGQLYVLEADGVRILDAQTGAAAVFYPFDHPAQPTAIAVDAAGMVYVGDAVCRCVRELTPQGRWRENVGSFGGGAPFHLVVSGDGTIYAVDKSDSGYLLSILGEPRDRTLNLNFNASAPPLVALDGAGQVWIVEWLSSLIDGATSGAVSLVTSAPLSASLRFWLESLTPETVTAFTTSPDGDLALATTDQGVLVVDASGTLIDRIAPETPLRQITFDADGTLYAVRADGVVTALSTGGVPDRVGNPALALGVPVQGMLSENAPQQSWTVDGTAGERLTLSAVDLARTSAFDVGLDAALRLLAPDGSEVAYDDDQRGDDLFGVYDAQIADVALPQSGTYTVRVEWRQGQGTYTLGISAAQPLTLSADGVTHVSGTLQDVFPTQRWAFAAHRGDTLTLTMRAESGTLDPTLAIRKPDGSLLAFNDDADDLELKNDSQLTQVRLPADGTYVIEASRYEGVGAYSLVIVNTG